MDATERAVIPQEAYRIGAENPIRERFEGPIKRVIHAFGGFDGPNNTYRLGDSATYCLNDLKRLLREDEHDDDRTVSRIFYETLLLPNDLIPALLATAGNGQAESPVALKTADLICALTWPIDVSEELKELDEDDPGAKAEYTQLIAAHRTYKAALLRPKVISALFAITLPSLMKEARKRTQRDTQVIGLFLHIVRNLAFIKDANVGEGGSADAKEWAGMHARYIRNLEETHVLEFLLTVAANEEEDKMFEQYNTVVLEIFYLLFRGVRPSGLTVDQKKVHQFVLIFHIVCLAYKLTSNPLRTFVASSPRKSALNVMSPEPSPPATPASAPPSPSSSTQDPPLPPLLLANPTLRRLLILRLPHH